MLKPGKSFFLFVQDVKICAKLIQFTIYELGSKILLVCSSGLMGVCADVQMWERFEYINQYRSNVMTDNRL
jgi:hypothetical protein